MIKNFKKTKSCYIILLLLVTSIAFAADETPAEFPTDVADNNSAVPINDYIIEALIIGGFVAFYSIKKTALKK